MATMPSVAIPSITPSSGASALVQSGWGTAQRYGADAVTGANTFLSSITTQSNALAGVAVLSDALAAPSKTIGVYVDPGAPSVPADIGFTVPTLANEPTFVDISAMVFDSAPTFTANVPVVNLPNAPAVLSTSLPAVPVLGTIAIPSSPALSLPTVPTLLGISVPTSPLLALPTFTAVMPNSPLAPEYIFSFAETAYTSSLLSSLRSQLETWIMGAATGLSPAVEQAIWDRGRSRETVNSSRKALEAVRAFAMRGFAKPPGMLAIELAEAAQEAQNANSALSRDVMVKQAELEQENRKFAFDQAFKVESELIGYNSQIAQRSYEAARYAQQVGIDICQQAIARYSTDVQSYAARVEQWKAATQSELTKLEKYRSDLEGQRLIGTLNEQSTQIYNTRVQAARAVIDIFKAQVDAVNAQAGINKTQIDSYAAQVGAYGETVRAKAAEYEGYATSVRAEVSKVDIFKSQTDAYRVQTEGFKTLVDAKIAQKTMEIKLNRDVPVDLFKMRTEVYRTKVMAETSRVGAVADVFGKQTQLYASKVSAQVGRMGAESEAFRSDVQYLQSAASVRIEVAKSNIEKMTQKIGMLIDAAKSGAQVQAQLAASALSAVHLSGNISDTASLGQSVNYSASQSSSGSYDYSRDVEQKSTSSSTTTSTSNSTGESTNYNYTRV